MKPRVWKTVPDFAAYEVSNYGEVRSKSRECPSRPGRRPQRRKGVLLKPDLPKGYPRVTFSAKGKTSRYTVHRLVATLFVPNPDQKPHVNHKDGNRTNNHYSNLEWVTASENHCHAFDILNRQPKGFCTAQKPTLCITTGKIYPSRGAAARDLGLAPGAITAVINGVYSHTKGYRFVNAKQGDEK